MLTSDFNYDAADQLTEASVPDVSSVLAEYVYRYDKAGNRTSEQIDNAVSAGTHNNLNQLKTLSATGPIRFAGSLNEAGTVTVNGQPIPVAGDNSFSGDVSLPPGSNSVAVVAKDPLDNTTTNNYTVAVASGTARTLTYDLVGNLTNNGAGQTYEWDAVNRLTKITYTGGARTEFTYDGLDRRVKIVEKNSGGSTTSEKRFVWDGMSIAEERDGSNNLTKRFYDQGVMVGSNEFYCTRDHLGSIRELTDDTGAIEARYDYDPCGRITKVTGSGDADFRFTGHYYHSGSGLNLALYRAYDVGLGRWLSRDPIGEDGGVGLYTYVSNDPSNRLDLLGLFESSPWLRATVPGQISWDNAITAGQNKQWGPAAVHLATMAGEQALFILTLGESMAASQGGKIVVAVCRAPTAEKTALEIAQQGGRHAGFLKNYLNKTPAELRKAITSLERQIAEHQAKIANPEKAIPNFRQIDPRQQKALLESKWPSDIRRQQQQLDILRGLLAGS